MFMGNDSYIQSIADVVVKEAAASNCYSDSGLICEGDKLVIQLRLDDRVCKRIESNPAGFEVCFNSYSVEPTEYGFSISKGFKDAEGVIENAIFNKMSENGLFLNGLAAPVEMCLSGIKTRNARKFFINRVSLQKVDFGENYM